MSNKLNELFHITGKNNFEFTYKSEGDDNFIGLDIKEKKILINISNPKDENLDVLIQETIETIKSNF
jgi:hypothetical protein